MKRLALLTAISLATTAAAQSDKPTVKKPSPPPAALSQDEGWNTQWALLFGLNNFIGGTGGFLSSSAAGTVSAEYFLTEDTGIRVGAFLRRSSTPVQVTKNVSTAGTDTVTTYTFNTAGAGDFHGVALSADYLKRMSNYAVAPYVGAGASVGWGWTRQAWVDEVSTVDQRIETNNNNTAINFDLRGIVGAEWRVHPNFALYAEYSASLTVIQSNMISNRTRTESTPGGTGTPATSETISESTRNAFLLLNTGLAQGGQLGLSVFF